MRRMVRTRYTRNSRRSTTVAMSIHSLTWFPDCLRTPSLASGSSPAARLSYMPPETHRHRPRQLSIICREGKESLKIIKPHFTAHWYFRGGSRILQKGVGEGWHAIARVLVVPSQPDIGGASPQYPTKTATALNMLCDYFHRCKSLMGTFQV